jgi:hypothetical protein
MGQITIKGHTAWRRYDTDGVPASGANQPDKAEIIDFVDEVDAEVALLQTAIAATNALIASLTQIGAGGMIGYTTKSAMDADLAHTDGTLAQVSYATDPANAGTYRKSGASGAGSWVSFPTVVDVLGPDIQKQVTVSPTASTGAGNGSPSNPYSFADAISSLTIDSSRRSIEIILKDVAGANRYRGPAMNFDMSRWREITVRTSTGRNFDWMATRFLAAGGSSFTQPDAAGAPNVWMVDNHYGNVAGNTAGIAYLIDIDATQACGRTGLIRSPTTLYGNLGNNVAASTMNATAYRGGVSMQTTGTNTGKLYVHARASLNPNSINFEQVMYDYCLLFYGLVGTNTHACRVNVVGVRAQYAAGAGIWADRAELHLENCEANNCHGYGFQLNQCWGEVASCVAAGNGADGYNGSASFADSSTLDRNVRLRLIDCRSNGNVQFPAPPTGSAVVGDGFSNHNSQTWHLINCYAGSAMKDGGSMTDSCLLSNFIAEDCATSGITFASQNAKATKAEVFGGRLSSNTYGIQCNANGSTETAQLDAYGTILDANVTNSLILTGNRPATINAYDVRTLGATPSGGHKSTSGNTGGGSAINVKTSTALA